MNRCAITLRRGVVGALGMCVVVAGTVPVAHAAPCKASGYAATASGVLAAAGGYLDAHPGADDVLTAAATQPTADARSSVRGYFFAHPGEFVDLKNIVQPLKDVKNQCGIDISPTQLAALFEAVS